MIHDTLCDTSEKVLSVDNDTIDKETKTLTIYDIRYSWKPLKVNEVINDILTITWITA